MLTVSSVSKELGGRPVLAGISFSANRGEVIGVTGPNGCGKTTLLRILAGELQPDTGRAETAPGLRIAYLAQGHAGGEDCTLAEAFPALFGSDALATRLEELATLMALDDHGARQQELADEYDRLLQTLASGSGDAAASALEALSVAHVSPQAKLRELSGGEATRLGLAALAAVNPQALLLDEPTNHLDIAGIEWVQRLIVSVPGPVVVVSHDRALLDDVATHILALKPAAAGAELFAGGYSGYAAEMERREAQQWEAYRRQQREERQLKQNIAAIESRSRHIENSTINFAIRKKAAKIARRSVTLKARLERQQESKEHLERPGKQPMGFYGGFEQGERAASRLVSAERLSIEAGGRRLFDDLTFQAHRGQALAVTGPNGSGKTTLMRAILGEHPVAGGSLEVASSARIGYLPQDDAGALSPEEATLTPLELMRRSCPLTEAEIANFLHRFLFAQGQVRTPIARLSYGERRRLALARLVLGGANLLLLDEPTNHLDLPSREAFEGALEGFEGGIIAVSHDRYFIEKVADECVELK